MFFRFFFLGCTTIRKLSLSFSSLFFIKFSKVSKSLWHHKNHKVEELYLKKNFYFFFKNLNEELILPDFFPTKVSDAVILLIIPCT